MRCTSPALQSVSAGWPDRENHRGHCSPFCFDKNHTVQGTVPHITSFNISYRSHLSFVLRTRAINNHFETSIFFHASLIYEFFFL